MTTASYTQLIAVRFRRDGTILGDQFTGTPTAADDETKIL